jgi:hypothetical protein
MEFDRYWVSALRFLDAVRIGVALAIGDDRREPANGKPGRMGPSA